MPDSRCGGAVAGGGGTDGRLYKLHHAGRILRQGVHFALGSGHERVFVRAGCVRVR